MNIEQEFVDTALGLYPELKGEFDFNKGLLHTQMGEFEIKVTESIRLHDKGKVLMAYMLMERCFRQGNNKMKNAVEVSFVEGVLSSLTPEEKQWGWDLMPCMLKGLYIDFWGQFRKYH